MNLRQMKALILLIYISMIGFSGFIYVQTQYFQDLKREVATMAKSQDQNNAVIEQQINEVRNENRAHKDGSHFPSRNGSKGNSHSKTR